MITGVLLGAGDINFCTLGHFVPFFDLFTSIAGKKSKI